MSDHDKIYSTKFQDKIERSTLLMFVMTAFAVAIGGIVEIVPLFYLPNTAMTGGDGTYNGTQHKDQNGNVISMDKIVWNPATSEHKTLDAWQPGDGVRPYKPLELAGRNVYIREGCFLCHSQMIRPLRDEVERYGHYSLAAESMYDKPFQWGSKRTGPDLARVGGKYSDDWHRDHLINPRSVVPESVMPPYAFLATKDLQTRDLQAKLRTMTAVGVPYTQEQIDQTMTDLQAQADPFSSDAPGLRARYGAKVVNRDFDGDPERLTEMDALIAYLQMLGTLVDFSTYQASAPANER